MYLVVHRWLSQFATHLSISLAEAALPRHSSQQRNCPLNQKRAYHCTKKAHGHTKPQPPLHRPIPHGITTAVHGCRRSSDNLHRGNTRWECRRWRGRWRRGEREGCWWNRGGTSRRSRTAWCIRVPCKVAVLLCEVFGSVEVDEAGLGGAVHECRGEHRALLFIVIYTTWSR